MSENLAAKEQQAKKAKKTRQKWWQLWREKPKKKELTREEQQAAKEKQQAADIAEFDRQKAQLEAAGEDAWPLWDREIIAALEEARETWQAEATEAKDAGHEYTEPWPTRSAVEKKFAEDAIADVERLEKELDRMQVRSALLLTILTVLFAVYTIRPSNLGSAGGIIGLVFLALALVINAVAFAQAIAPLAPPLKRSRKPYNKRQHQTLLARNPFLTWVYHCWLGERRTPIIQAYKRAHAVVVRLLIVAAITAIPGIVLGIIFR